MKSLIQSKGMAYFTYTLIYLILHLISLLLPARTYPSCWKTEDRPGDFEANKYAIVQYCKSNFYSTLPTGKAHGPLPAAVTPCCAASCAFFCSNHSFGCIFFRWENMLALELNVLSQKLHVYSASPVCEAMCSRSPRARLNCFPQS